MSFIYVGPILLDLVTHLLSYSVTQLFINVVAHGLPDQFG